MESLCVARAVVVVVTRTGPGPGHARTYPLTAPWSWYRIYSLIGGARPAACMGWNSYARNALCRVPVDRPANSQQCSVLRGR